MCVCVLDLVLCAQFRFVFKHLSAVRDNKRLIQSQTKISFVKTFQLLNCLFELYFFLLNFSSFFVSLEISFPLAMTFQYKNMRVCACAKKAYSIAFENINYYNYYSLLFVKLWAMVSVRL